MMYCVFLFLPASVAPGAEKPIVGKVVVIGNEHISTRDLLAWLELRPSVQYSPALLDSDLIAIKNHYVSAGFLNCHDEVKAVLWSSDSSRIDLTIEVREGPRTLLHSIALTGSTFFSVDALLDHFDLRAGMPFDRSLLEGDIAAVLSRYESAGFPFARCQVADMRIEEGSEGAGLDMVLSIDEGRRLYIDEVRVTGNKETDPTVVVRETRLGINELFDPAKVGKIRDRLRRLNIFSDVKDPELFVRDTVGGLRIQVEEGNTNTFDGIIGYIPSTESGQPGYVNGLASVTMRNLFGTGRKLSFRWQREDRFSQEIGVQYLEPWIFDEPINLGGSFQQRQQDSSYVTTNLALKAELMLSEELSVSLLFGSMSVIPSASVVVAGISRSISTSAGAEILYDTRDDNYSPTSGARYRTDYHYGRRRIAGSSSSVQRFSVDIDFFLSTFPRQVVAIGLHGRQVQGDSPEESELYRFGGTHTLRGYRENQFLGSRIAWSNFEYRFLLARKSFLYGFLDTGYYYRPADAARSVGGSDDLKVGYGIGIQLSTGLGVMGVSFALGEGDSFSTAKIHFGLINDF